MPAAVLGSRSRPARTRRTELTSNVYARLGLIPVINAAGDLTRVGGAIVLPAVRRAMSDAARSFVPIAEMQEAAARVVAEATGAESGYVTSGAAAGLTLAAAACIARLDPVVMNRLPDAGDAPNEVLVPLGHRSSYDRCFRTAGATVRYVDTSWNGVIDLAAHIGPRTCAIAWAAHRASPDLPLIDVVEAAHRHGVVVIVDASLGLPPAENLSELVRAGADLICFSAGKSLGGPQAGGFLAGRAELIRSVAMQHQDMAANPWWESGDAPTAASELGPPGQGLGRPMKVDRQVIAGTLVALQLYVRRDHRREARRWRARVERIADGLSGLRGIDAKVHVPDPGSGRPIPRVILTVDPTVAGMTAAALEERLRTGSPRVVVSSYAAHQGTLEVFPQALEEREVEPVISRIREVLDGK